MVQHDSSDAAVEESPREAPDAADDAVEGAVKEDIRMGQIATYSINGMILVLCESARCLVRWFGPSFFKLKSLAPRHKKVPARLPVRRDPRAPREVCAYVSGHVSNSQRRRG